jgi:hypothetical protein
MAFSFAFCNSSLPHNKNPDLCRPAFPLAPKVHKRGEQYPLQWVSAFLLHQILSVGRIRREFGCHATR